MPRFSLRQYLQQFMQVRLNWSEFLATGRSKSLRPQPRLFGHSSNADDSKARRRRRFISPGTVEILEPKALLSAAPVPSGLVAWWTGDNGGTDVTGNNNGVLYSVGTAPGEVGQTLSFDGSSSRMEVPDNHDLALTSSLSIEGWVNITAFPSASAGGGMIFFRGDNRPGLDPIVMSDNSSGQLSFQVESLTQTAVVSAPISTNQWVYVAGTLDASTGLMSLYLNGTLVSQITTSVTAFGPLDPTQDPGVGIGNANGGPGGYNVPFNGLIDELSVYDIALTQAQIQSIYNAGGAGKMTLPSTTVTSVATSGPGITAGNGIVGNGDAVTFTVNFSAPVTVDTGSGSPTLTLSDGGTAVYTGGSGTTALTFVDTVLPGQSSSDLSVTALNRNGSSLESPGSIVDASGAAVNPAGVLQVDTNHPYTVSIVPSGPTSPTSDSFTVTFSKAVTGVDTNDFRVVTTGGVTDTGFVVTPISGSVYTVTVNGIAGAGTLGLNLVDNRTIHDLAGNVLVGLDNSNSFLPQQTVAVGGNPDSIAWGYANTDALPDLVVANGASNSVSVLLGNGNGTFQPQQTYATGVGPTSVAVADLTGNGKLDIVVTCQGGFDVLLGNGNGTFQSQLIDNIGENPSSLKIADLNGDGKPDLVFTNPQSYSVTVMLGNGDGSFQAPMTFSTGLAELFSGGEADSIAVADLNHDGKPDLVVSLANSANHFDEIPEQIGVLLGNGDGTFQQQQTYAVGSDVDLPTSVTVADLNGDGFPDIVATSYGIGDASHATILFGNGDGTFQPMVTYATGADPSSVAVGDINGDGAADLVIPNNHNANVTILQGIGDGTFIPEQQNFSVGSAPSAVTLADFNSDGELDMAVANSSDSTVSILLNNNGNVSGPVYTLNHAPTGQSNTVFTLLNTPYTFRLADFGFSDPNDNPPNSFTAVEFTTLPNAGVIKDNGAALTAGQFVPVADITGGKLTFTPSTNLFGGPYFLARFQVQDSGGSTNGGQNLDPVPKVLDIQITHLNHAPLGTSGTVTTNFDTAYTFKTSDFGFTDPTDVPPNSLLAVKVSTLPVPTVGTLIDNGVAVTAGQFVSAADIGAGKFIFTPNANLGYGTYNLLKFQVEDNGGTAGGGANLDPNPKSLSVLINVSHAPIGTSGTVTSVVGVAYRFKPTDFGFTDPNDNPPNSFIGVYISLLPNAGTLTDNFSLVRVNSFIPIADITEGKLVFTPNTNIGKGPYFLMKFQVWDNGSTAGGGQFQDPTPKVLDIQFVNLNHAPLGTSGTVTTPKNTTYQFKTSDFGFSDPYDSPPNTFLAVKITLLPTAGTLLDNGVAVTTGQFISVADITAGKFVFKPNTNLTGGPYFLCKFQVQDNGGTVGGGVDLDPIPKVLDVQIKP